MTGTLSHLFFDLLKKIVYPFYYCFSVVQQKLRIFSGKIIEIEIPEIK